MKKRRVAGRIAEDLVAHELERMGYTVIARNFHGRWGEIDIVAKKDRRWYVIEVKGTGGGSEIYWRVTPRKLKALQRTWWEFARLNGVNSVPILLFAFVGNLEDKPQVEFIEEVL